MRRDVVGWRDELAGERGLAAATVNAHLASLSAFTTWVAAQAPQALPQGDPTNGVRSLPLPALEPRALTEAQVRSLKSVLDRLDRQHQLKGRRRAGDELHGHGRPARDRAIVYLLLSTGLRREELVRLNLAQLSPRTPGALRGAKRARISGVRGKGASHEPPCVRFERRARGAGAGGETAGGRRQPASPRRHRLQPVPSLPATARRRLIELSHTCLTDMTHPVSFC